MSGDFDVSLERELGWAFSHYRRKLLRRALWAFDSRKRYVSFLKHMAWHAQNVIEVMELAIGALPDEQAKQAFRHHQEEEKGHDRVAKADLKALGVEDDMTQYEPPVSAMLLDGYTRALATRQPVAVLGFLLTAEGLASRFGARVTRILRFLGYSEKSLRFLKLHAEVDVRHFQELKAMCLEFGRTEAQQRAILQTIRATAVAMAEA